MAKIEQQEKFNFVQTQSSGRLLKTNHAGANNIVHILNRNLLLNSTYASGSMKPATVNKISVKRQKLIRMAIKNARILGIIKTSYI